MLKSQSLQAKAKKSVQTSIERNFLKDSFTLQNELSEGKLTHEGFLLESIKNIKQNHEQLNAAVHLFEEEATQALKYLPNGKLKGIPISVKEIIATKGTEITAASYIYPAHTPVEDAPIIQRLKAEGAVILAKGNIPEFSMSHETRNIRFGKTSNPYDISRSSGGSSGGEAALVASGSVVAGIGTDLGGSVRYPAHCCGLVGFKPTSTTIAKTGVYPEIEENSFLQSMLSVGPITRSVRDAKRFTEVMKGSPFAKKRNMAQKGRLILPEKFTMAIRNPAISQALAATKEKLTSFGFEAVTTQKNDSVRAYKAFLRILMRNTFGRPNREPTYTSEGKRFTLWNEAIRQVKGNPILTPVTYFALLGVPFINPTALQAKQEEENVVQLREEYNQLLGEDGILLLPTSGEVALKHGVGARHDFFSVVPRLYTPMIFTNVLDLPSITVPAWRFCDAKTGLPASIMLTTAAGNEHFLFEIAEWLEERLTHFKNSH